MSWNLLPLLLLALLAGLGCGDQLLVKISGYVSYNNEPIEKGEILFNDAKGKQKPKGAEIKNGKYEIMIYPGDKTVQIFATREIPSLRTEMGPVFKGYIPEKYNTKSRLTAKVVPEGNNQFNFDLKGPPLPK